MHTPLECAFYIAKKVFKFFRKYVRKRLTKEKLHYIIKAYEFENMFEKSRADDKGNYGLKYSTCRIYKAV